jgi:outer membrane lipoprotein carrier protein
MYNQALRFFAALLVLITLTPLAIAAESLPTDSPTALVVQLQKKYQQLRSLEFDFTQFTQTGGRVKQGSGNATFYRPTGATPSGKGIMRWNYLAPTPQTITNDGRELSIYTPQDRQLIISPVQDLEADITYALFTGTRDMLDAFTVSQGDAQFTLNQPPANAQSALLTPREPHPQLKRVQLWLSRDNVLHRLLMEDHFGALTELSFSNMRFNTLRLHDQQQVQSLLNIDLAPGTETIRQ